METRPEVLLKRDMNGTKESEVDHEKLTTVLMHLPGGERLPGHLALSSNWQDAGLIIRQSRFEPERGLWILEESLDRKNLAKSWGIPLCVN